MDDFAFARAMGALAAGEAPFAVATIVRTFGSTLGKPGFRLLIGADGAVLEGSLGGGCPEGPIVSAALEAIESGRPRLLRVYLQDAEAAVKATVAPVEEEVHVEVDCGGGMDVYVEPFRPTPRLVLLAGSGQDAVVDHLVPLAKALEFTVIVVGRAPDAGEDEVHDPLDFDLSAFAWRPSDAVLVLTRTERSVGLLEELSRTPVAYVGLMASRRRARRTREALEDHGVPEAFRRSLHAPVGLDIGARTPGEIALSILAEIVALQRGVPSPSKGDVTASGRRVPSKGG